MIDSSYCAVEEWKMLRPSHTEIEPLNPLLQLEYAKWIRSLGRLLWEIGGGAR